jgi:hypothetical protein
LTSTVLGSCDLRHQFLTPIFFRSSWTDSSDPNLGFPTHWVPSGLRSTSFMQGSSSFILQSVYFNTVLQFSSGPYSHRHTEVPFFGTFLLLPHRLITRFSSACPINSAAMFIPEWLKWYCSSQGTVYLDVTAARRFEGTRNPVFFTLIATRTSNLAQTNNAQIFSHFLVYGLNYKNLSWRRFDTGARSHPSPCGICNHTYFTASVSEHDIEVCYRWSLVRDQTRNIQGR